MRKIYLSITFIFVIMLTSFTVSEQKILIKKNVEKVEIKKENKLEKWDILIQALIYVESSGNDTIEGTACNTNAIGCLQITPIYVKEVNRLLGDTIYKLIDRRNRQKSIEMFNIYQKFKNPTKNIDKAIYLHNPTAFSDYKQKVLSKFNKLLNNKI